MLELCWRPDSVSYHGRHYRFDDVWVEPRPFRLEGPVLAAGFSTICFKPSMYLDDARDLGAFCRRLVAKAEAITS